MARYVGLGLFAVSFVMVVSRPGPAQDFNPPPPGYRGTANADSGRYPLPRRLPAVDPRSSRDFRPQPGTNRPFRPTDRPTDRSASTARFDFGNRPPRRQAPPPPVIYEPAKLVAVVGDQPIFLGDLLGPVNQMLEPYVGKAPKEQLDQQREKLIPQMLQMAIQTKLLYLDFIRILPEPEKQLPEISKNVSDTFYSDQLPQLVESFNVSTPAELESKLLSHGSSIEKMRRAFVEQAFASQAVQEKVNKNVREITHQEMVAYYREHISDYELISKARWEHMMVRFDKFPNRGEAERAIRYMRDRVYLGGARFAEVARQMSQGPDAYRGGYHDWTTQGSLVSDVLDQAIFSIPPGRISNILADDKGLHVVQVLARRDKRWITFKAPAGVRVEQAKFEQDKYLKDKYKVNALISNTGTEEVTVELSAYTLNARKKPVFKKTLQVNVPPGNGATAEFELNDIHIEGRPEDEIRLNLEPQKRIMAAIRKEIRKQRRDDYLKELRVRTTPLWTIYDEKKTARQPGASSDVFSPR